MFELLAFRVYTQYLLLKSALSTPVSGRQTSRGLHHHASLCIIPGWNFLPQMCRRVSLFPSPQCFTMSWTKMLAKLNILDFYASLKCNLFKFIVCVCMCVCVHACTSCGDEGDCGSWFSPSTRNTDCFMILHVSHGQGPILVCVLLKLAKSQWP